MIRELEGAVARASWSPATYLERPVTGRAWKATTPLVKRVGCAARSALTDHYVVATGAVPPTELARRVQVTSEVAAQDGRDPVRVVEVAMVVPVLVTAYQLAYKAGTGEAAPTGLIASAAAQAVTLLVDQAVPSRVQAAMELAATRRHQHVTTTYSELTPTVRVKVRTIFDEFPA